MSISRIARLNAPGEVRAVAFDSEDRAVSTFIERWDGQGQPASLGQTMTGRLRKVSPSDGGGFFELASGEDVFVRGAIPDGLTLGAETCLLIVAEQRHEKLARARVVESTDPSQPGFERWRTSLPGNTTDDVDESPEAADDVERVFDEVLSPTVGLPGGGALHIDRTSALTAIDVDSAGRTGRGSAGARAYSINREAVAESARHIALRRLGGLIVIDCVAPINRDAGEKLQADFLAGYKACSNDAIDALRPSKYGLLEAKVAWGRTPLSDLMLDSTGAQTPETELLAVLRALQREAAADRTSFFSLALSKAAMGAYKLRKAECDTILKNGFSGRVTISDEMSETSKVVRT
ncbi:ribonuclease E/G [Henriciella sp. AS95]|uniref:ribonuclease E/G n=1 Tax=Henriciella sp. AS95 TaxID=3135782 RepID=UPI00316FB5D0